MNIANFLSQEEKQMIVGAIKKAELSTSAEIRVHIDSVCATSVLDSASRRFEKLGMQKTKERNGVLIYVAINSRKCAIIGDIAINQVVDKNFWNKCYAILIECFSKEDYAKGISKVIEMCGEVFATHFKYTSDDVNELPDEISFGK